METNAIPALKPLRLGELFDQAVRLYRRNFMAFFGIIAMVYIPYAVLQIAFSLVTSLGLRSVRTAPESYIFSSAYWLTLFGGFTMPVIRFVFVNGLGTAALTYAIARNYLGQKVGILGSYRHIGSLWVKLLLVWLLFSALLVAAFIWGLVPCVGWLTGMGLLVFLLGVVAPLLPAVVVIEKTGVVGALVRAWDLARQRFWWLLGFAVILYLFNLLVAAGPTWLASYLIGLVFGRASSLTPSSAVTVAGLLGGVAGSLIELVILPLPITVWALTYFDLRVRSEGFDLALLALDPSADAELDFARLPAAAPSRKWLTGEDVGRLLVVSLVGMGIYALLFGVLMLIGVGVSSFTGGL
jgi:hypothetical protein